MPTNCYHIQWGDETRKGEEKKKRQKSGSAEKKQIFYFRFNMRERREMMGLWVTIIAD